MANFVRENPLGWAIYDLFTSAQANGLDIKITKTINAADGSAHTPSADIELTGPFGLKLMGSQLLKYQERTVPRKATPRILEAVNWQYAKSIPIQTGLGNVYLALEPLAHGSVLDSVSLRWKGGAGHTSNPVSGGITVPALQVFYLDAFGVEQPLGSQSDNGAVSPAVYESGHPIALTGIGHTVDLINNHYYVRLTSETGAEFQTGGTIESLKPACKVSAQPEY